MHNNSKINNDFIDPIFFYSKLQHCDIYIVHGNQGEAQTLYFDEEICKIQFLTWSFLFCTVSCQLQNYPQDAMASASSSQDTASADEASANPNLATGAVDQGVVEVIDHIKMLASCCANLKDLQADGKLPQQFCNEIQSIMKSSLGSQWKMIMPVNKSN